MDEKKPWLSCQRGEHQNCLARHPDSCKCKAPPPDCGCDCHKVAAEPKKEAA
jgi:hypothetical protein